MYSFLNSSLFILFPCLNTFRGSQHLSGIHGRCLGVAHKAGLASPCCLCLYSLVHPCLTESHAASWLLPSPCEHPSVPQNLPQISTLGHLSWRSQVQFTTLFWRWLHGMHLSCCVVPSITCLCLLPCLHLPSLTKAGPGPWVSAQPPRQHSAWYKTGAHKYRQYHQRETSGRW